MSRMVLRPSENAANGENGPSCVACECGILAHGFLRLRCGECSPRQAATAAPGVHVIAGRAVYAGPYAQEARQAAQRWAEALHALYDVQPGLCATQEAGQSAAQRLAEAGSAEGDAADPEPTSTALKSASNSGRSDLHRRGRG